MPRLNRLDRFDSELVSWVILSSSPQQAQGLPREAFVSSQIAPSFWEVRKGFVKLPLELADMEGESV